MTRDELIKELLTIAQRQEELGDVEMCREDDHVAADRLLLRYINSPEVTQAFEAIERWYS